MVTADETQVPLGTEVDFTAEVGDAEEVTIWVLDADDVTVTGGDVSFETDTDGDFDSGLADAGTRISAVNGVAIPAAQFRNVTSITDGTVTFSVTAASNDAYVALVAETEDFTAGDVPEVDADGVPVDGFGVSDTVNVQDVVGVALLDADRTETTVFGVENVSVRPEGATVNVTAVLFDDANPLSDDAAVAAVSGSLDYVIVDGAEVAGTDPGSIPLNDIVTSGTVSVTDGVASFSFEGGDDPDIYTILVEWEGAEDSAYEDESARAYGGVGLLTHGQIEFSDDPAIGTSASFVDEDDQFVAVNGTATVQVEVLDQFGNPASGVDVVFDDVTATFTRSTNASGIASFAFSEDTNTLTNVSATIADEEDVVIGIGAVGSGVDVYWYSAAPIGENGGEVLFLSANSSWVVIESGGFYNDDTGQYLRVNVETGAYVVDSSAVTLADFIDALEDEADADFVGADGDTSLFVNEGYRNANITTTYQLFTSFTDPVVAIVDASDPVRQDGTATVEFTSNRAGTYLVLFDDVPVASGAVTAIAPEIATFTVPDPTAEGTSTVEVLVSDGATTGVGSAEVDVTVDNTAPLVNANTADANDTTFTVTFNEQVDAASAEMVGNYTITDADGLVTITSASLDADGVTVTLVTTALNNTGADVTLDQTVEDVAGNPGTQIGYVLVASA